MAAHLRALRSPTARALRSFRRQLPSAQAADFSTVPTVKDNVALKNLALRAARGGRSSVSGIRATVFGSTGFLGRYVVNRLGQIGSQVVLPHRWDQRDIQHMKLMGDLGQMIPVPYQIRDPESVARVLQGSNVVVNLMGVDYDTWNYTMHDVHVNATEMACKKAVEAGVDRFIHISSAGASPDADCRWLRTKWQGEEIVKSYYPEATILRPSIMYGVEDNFIQQIAQFYSSLFRLLKKPFMYNGFQKIQPVAVQDVALAVMRCIQDPVNTCGKTYSLFGEMTATRRQFHERIRGVLEMDHYGTQNIDPDLVMPFWKLVEPLERKMPLLFRGRPNKDYSWHMTADLLRRKKVDFISDNPADRDMPGLRELGITPMDYFQEEARLLQKHYMIRGAYMKNDYENLFRSRNYKHREWEVANQWHGQGPHPNDLLVSDEPLNAMWWDEDWEKDSHAGKGGAKNDFLAIITFWTLTCGIFPWFFLLGGVDATQWHTQFLEWIPPFIWDRHPSGVPWWPGEGHSPTPPS